MMKYSDFRNDIRKRISILTRLISLTLFVPLGRCAPSAHSSQQDQICGFRELQQCAKPLRVLANAQDLLFVRDLDQACLDLQAGLRCVHRYARMCMSNAQADHLAKLYRGTQATVRELCSEGPYRLDFLRHSKCTVKASAAYGVCTNKFQNVLDNMENVRLAENSHMKIVAADVNKRRDMQMKKQMVIDKVDIHVPTYAPPRNGKQARNIQLIPEIPPKDTEHEKQLEIERLRPLCCAFKRLDACAFDAMKYTCGSETAYFVSDFIRGMSANAMRMHCALYAEENSTEICGPEGNGIDEPVLLELKTRENSARGENAIQNMALALLGSLLLLSIR